MIRKCVSWKTRCSLITLSETIQMEILPQTVESNPSLYLFIREGHQTPSLSCTATNTELTHTHGAYSLFLLAQRRLFISPCSTISFFFIIQMMHILTLRSGMENLQHEEARLVLAMVRLSFSTLVKLVLSSGTEISQKSVMTPHRYCLWHQTVILSRQTYSNMNSITEICWVLF